MLVKEIMSKDVVTVDVTDNLLKIAKLMKRHNIGAVPVTQNKDEVIGMITDRDIVLGLTKKGAAIEDVLAESIMSDKVYSIKPGANVSEALALMKKKQIRRLPVIEKEKLVGMLSLGDIAVSHHNDVEISEAITEISKPQKKTK